MLIDVEGVSKDNYPLAWLIGDWQGTGQFGGHFNLENSHIMQNVLWKNEIDHLAYNSQMRLAKFDGDGNFKVDENDFIFESGKFYVLKDKIAETQQKTGDDQIFPVSCEILTKWKSDDSSQLVDAWKVKYVGLIGKGKLELVSDEIQILNPDFEIANNLWRSKRLYGYVPSQKRLMWVWDISQIGASDEENGLQSIFSAGLEKEEG